MIRKILSTLFVLTLFANIAFANQISFFYNKEKKLTGEILYPTKVIIPKYVQKKVKKTGATPKVLPPLIVFVPEDNTYYDDEPMTSFLEHGYAVAIVDHSPNFPQNVIETKAAIRHIKMNANKYKIDGDKIGVWGGNTAAFVAVTPTHPEFEDYSIVKEGESSRVRASLLVAPCIKEPSTRFHDVINYVDASSSHAFVVNSAVDKESPIDKAENFAHKLKLSIGFNNVTFVKTETLSSEKFIFDKNMVKRVIDFFDNKFKLK